MKPQDARQVAKILGDFWKASISKVDSDRLLHDLLGAGLSASQITQIFGSKAGGKFAAASREGIKKFEEYKVGIENVPENYPEQIARERMAGVAGAMERLKAATENLGIAFVAANERWITPTLNEATKLANAFARLDGTTLEAVTAIGGVVGGLGALGATLKGLSFLGLTGAAIKGGASAVGGVAAAMGGVLVPTVGGVLGGALAALWPTPAGAGENELARQRARGLGAFRLGNAPPETVRFTPWPAGLKRLSRS